MDSDGRGIGIGSGGGRVERCRPACGGELVVESAFELSNDAIEAQIEGIVLQFEMLQTEHTSG